MIPTGDHRCVSRGSARSSAPRSLGPRPASCAPHPADSAPCRGRDKRQSPIHRVAARARGDMAITITGEGGRTLLLARRGTTRSRRPTRGGASELAAACVKHVHHRRHDCSRQSRASHQPVRPGATRSPRHLCAHASPAAHAQSASWYAGKLRKYLGSAIPRATFRRERSPRSSRIHRRAGRDAVLLSECAASRPPDKARRSTRSRARQIEQQLRCRPAEPGAIGQQSGWLVLRTAGARFHARYVGRDRLYGSGSKRPCTRKKSVACRNPQTARTW